MPYNSQSRARDQSSVVGPELLSIAHEVTYALDDFRNSVSAVVARAGQFLHAGRVYTHSSGGRGRRTSDPADNRSQTRGLSRLDQRNLTSTTSVPSTS